MLGEQRQHPLDASSASSASAWSQRPGPRSPAEVREEVRLALEEARRSRRRDVVGDDVVGDALLVASELTTNAMLHGGGVTGFEVSLDDGDVRLSVSDRSQELPTPKQHVDERGFMRAGGHGWPIVCRLARDITISELGTGGKRITAVLPLVRQ
ncbi:ATP-binding protein [Streptomyces sp. NPDC001815]|uniref:ATP-binding protein n=1 Tax=Streptomyces sp. NPDC001815 TaxID=3154526 RepID=UPI00331A2280